MTFCLDLTEVKSPGAWYRASSHVRFTQIYLCVFDSQAYPTILCASDLLTEFVSCIVIQAVVLENTAHRLTLAAHPLISESQHVCLHTPAAEFCTITHVA